MTQTATTAAAQPSGPTPAPFDWEEVYRANFKPVWRFLARLGVRPEHLEDVTHEVFLTAFRRLDSYDATRPVTPWLFGIAFRLGGDFKQLSFIRREQPAEETNEPLTETSGPVAEKAVAARQARRMLDEILESMDLEKRAVFVMHELDGLQVPEIARALELPLATAYSRLRLARQQYEAGVKRLKAKVSHGSA